MLTIYLVRHGQKQSTLPDPELTELGNEQARKTAHFFQGKGISKIIASPMMRTKQTAEHIAQLLGLPVYTDHRLKERMDYQDYKESTMDQFLQEWSKATDDRLYMPQWGDSSFNTGKRVQQLIEEFDQKKDQQIALVTHGGAIADFLKNNCEMFEEQMVKTLMDKDFHVLECSVTTVMKKGNAFFLGVLHSVGHLK